MSGKMRKLTLLSLLLVLGLLMVACQSQPAADDGEPDTTQEEPVVEEPVDEPEEPVVEEPEEPAEDDAGTEGERKVATFIFTQEFDSLNPLYTSMWFSTITLQIWNAAGWDFDADLNVVPVLLSEVPSVDNGGISEDGTTITFNLRDDIVWSDGEPITADDFIFTYEMVVDPGNAVTSTYPYDLVADASAPDDRTVVMEFEEPFAPWQAYFWRFVLPEHVLGPVYEAEGTLDSADWNLAPTVGAGPYTFAEWESGSFARFVRNDNYYGEAPIIDEIFIRFVPDDASQIAALRNAEGDLGTFIAYSDIPMLEDAGVEVAAVPSGYAEGWFPYLGDEGHPALKDVLVRQALAHAFDRFALVNDLLLGETEVAATLWDDTPYVDPSIEPYPYDPDRARELLDEAGWVDSNDDGTRDKDGVELVLLHGTTTREIRQDAQAVAQQQLADVGVGLDIINYDADIFFAGVAEGGPAATGELDIFQWSDAPFYPDPDHYYWLCSEIPTEDYQDGGNWQRICDEELDALFRQQASQTDVEERTATFHEITRHMFDEVYWLGVWKDPDIWAFSERLQPGPMSGPSPFYSIAEWDIAQ
ncbi:MAG TPA: peptide ABC transporter substrate-binding protein [Candidatus Sulfomarinibacteraceae bacterium]|nr:peptide ABC transporter substrate-binding protein [Candidatus Sulfomarinibacteraceae bacterium]